MTGCWRLSIVVVMLLLAGRADAIIVAPMTFERLVAEAAAVVYARVADVRGRWTADRHSIDSIVTLEALRYLKGNFGPSVLVRLPGGEVGNVINVLPGAPILRQGDLLIVFLVARGPAIPDVLGLTQGVFRVSLDRRAGTMLVSPPPLKASVAGAVVRGAADRRMLDLAAFEANVRMLEGER
jgi:hypothetical protein